MFAIPNNGFHHVFVELCSGILARNLELVSRISLEIEYVNSLIKVRRNEHFNLVALRINSAYFCTPNFGDSLSVPCVVGYIAVALQTMYKGLLSGVYNGISHEYSSLLSQDLNSLT